ncbi:hypothetical protein A1O3_07906 [Capronia epimyces CBS 606.96]|uniref:Uncharacterized protein n=1 Tax=Capronia epimyces CBS 606.96 TaxID=1182542 RepID=W9XGI3_9EURO|nr:uncharacterized protein A1O3_07906 [Capronia epimyces CBS 606.96]EXJ79627.1 hypothetical protein A1O3_07906 [Capronia epimyces CBS 606.96]
MGLQTIYVVRHGFRQTWPDSEGQAAREQGIFGPADASLSPHGFDQATELAAYAIRLNPPVGAIYSSPMIRCLQTVAPTVNRAAEEGKNRIPLRIEHGLGEWFGADGAHDYTPSSLSALKDQFPACSSDYVSLSPPILHGEDVEQLHNRLAGILTHLIARADEEGHSAILLCSHAAVVVAIGHVLLGRVHQDVTTKAIGAFTCGVSTYTRNLDAPNVIKTLSKADNEHLGLWSLTVNCDCSFLTNGAERGWRFSGLSRFTRKPLELGDEVDDGTGLGVVVNASSATLGK